MADRKKMRASSATKTSRSARPAGRTDRRGSRGTSTRSRTLAIADRAQEHAEQVRQRQPQKKGQQQGGEKRSPGLKEPRSPMPPQHQSHPGFEWEMQPAPHFEAPAYRPAGKLNGLVALITGGDSGIGRAVATIFAREGADVAIVYLSETEDAMVTRAAVEAAGRRCWLIPGDVTDTQFCQDAVEQTVRQFGHLDILVNNAAFQQHQASLADISEEQWDLTFRTNIYGYFHMAKAALPHLKPGSAIINTGSVTGLEGSKELLDYSSTKGAIHAFTKSLAQNLVSKGIRVNCVAPGPVWTPLNVVDNPPEEVSQFGSDVPYGRPAEPEEIAPAYVFLASRADSSYITGEVLAQLGGETTAG